MLFLEDVKKMQKDEPEEIIFKPKQEQEMSVELDLDGSFKSDYVIKSCKDLNKSMNFSLDGKRKAGRLNKTMVNDNSHRVFYQILAAYSK